MTRSEHADLTLALNWLRAGSTARADAVLQTVLSRAEREFAAEDRHHDVLEADAYPINVHNIAAE